jgi:predicted TIM-barrel fold metal-dependent hydrolase
MKTNHEAWLAQIEEDPIDSSLPICDPHHHLWDRPGSYYMIREFLKDVSGGHNIVQTVFVECAAMYRRGGPIPMRPVGETEFAQGAAARSASGLYGPTAVAAGIVSHADLTLGSSVVAVLEAHMTAGHDRFRGIRYQSACDPSPDIQNARTNPHKELFSDPKFQEGFARLREHGLTFDAWMFFHQILDLVDLAAAFPQTTIILDHVGTPLLAGPYEGKRAQVFEQWKDSISAIAARPNMVVKLGGLAMPICGFGWDTRDKPPTSQELADETAPYFLHCIEQFGADRCMFESNFPVDKLSCSYTVLWNSYKRITQDFSRRDRLALFHDTAARVYRLSSAEREESDRDQK